MNICILKNKQKEKKIRMLQRENKANEKKKYEKMSCQVQRKGCV